MKIYPFDKIICRTPAFGLNQTMDEVWEELKIKIEESSPGFYQLIKNLGIEDLKSLDDKTQLTIWKYFNRAKFRATPFGSFAAISIFLLGYRKADEIILEKNITQFHFIDWSQKQNNVTTSILDAKYLISNATIYFVAQEIRYIKATNGAFELAAVNTMPQLNTILLTCKRKTKTDEIYEIMLRVFNMSRESTVNLLAQLIDLQLLKTDLHSNIIGQDYFERLNILHLVKPSNYIIAERSIVSGNFDVKALKQIPELINFFRNQFSAPKNKDLQAFKIEFNKRFENKELSLAMVMDPQVGIGYGNLAQLNSNSHLLDDIKEIKNIDPDENITYGKLQQFLLNKMIDKETIDLADFNLTLNKNTAFANSFSVMFHLYNGKPVIASAGGCTANALIGRFTISNKTIEKYANEIASLEANANSDILFFDIAYQTENKVDNINRRKQIYTHELPILTWPETENILDLNDILVAIEFDEVILKSKKFGKRLIPRLASAYNYTRSDLAVYRFLCDIQSQGLLANFSFSLQDIFPYLTYYPRLYFKEIVLSPAMWLLPKTVLKDAKNLKNWLALNKIEESFKVGHADQSLCINPKKDEDIWALLMYGKQQNADIYLTEALINKADLINDEYRNCYLPQYIANYYHLNSIYYPSAPVKPEPNQLYLPGSEWLYFEIYCHPSKSNYLLLELISEFLKLNHRKLKKWFFIRYTDPKPHIRLRLHLKNVATSFSLVNDLQTLIVKEIDKGFINDFKLPIYNKEVQRYGANKIDLVEQFFYYDSKYVFYILKYSFTENQLIAKTMLTVKQLCNISFLTLDEQLEFTKMMANSFANEMQLNAPIFKKINHAFNQLELVDETLNKPLAIINKRQQIFNEIILKCEDKLTKEKMLADLIHMHINRVFIADQRVYETIIYHHLMRWLQTKLALSKPQ